jgi:crotonobetainyl-CoA:carnitine CoA-transferase CaiB-like acyl-CoA transferase
MSGPLKDVRVIDLTSVAMGPYATQILGDMGADVVKVESRDGDVFRQLAPARNPGMGAMYLNLNRNKRSIALDLKRDDERKVLLDLVAGADVFVSNVRPASLQKLGLDHASLRQAHPRLIYCGMYGFSEAGPYAGRPAYDDIIQAMSGLAALQGHNSSNGPEYVNTMLADKVAGLTAAYAIAMALYERERSGQGQAIEVPMFETMVSFNLIEHLAGMTFLPSQANMCYERMLSPHRRPYRTRDGFLALLPYTTAQWHRFFEVAGRPELARDPRFSDMAARSRNIDALYEILATTVVQRTTAEWVEILKDADIPMTPVRAPADLLHDEHLRQTGFFQEQQHPSEGTIRALGVPVRFSRTPGAIRRPAPALDADRASVLAEVNHADPAAPRSEPSPAPEARARTA